MKRTVMVLISVFAVVGVLVSVADASSKTKIRSWDTLKLRDLVTSMNSGIKDKFGTWHRYQAEDGEERWVSTGYGAHENWEIRPSIVLYGTLIKRGNREQANRFVLMTALLTNGVMSMEGYKSKNIGEILVKLSKAAAIHPGQDISVDEGPYILTFTKVEDVNAWVYTIEPR